jgi:hypothetical protein
MLEGHLASSRLTSTRRSRWSKSSVFRLALSCRIGKSGCETCSWRARVKKKRQRTGPGMMRGPVWRGPQAAGKRHSQPFSAKRLRHAWLGSSPTKLVSGQFWPPRYGLEQQVVVGRCIFILPRTSTSPYTTHE